MARKKAASEESTPFDEVPNFSIYKVRVRFQGGYADENCAGKDEALARAKEIAVEGYVQDVPSTKLTIVHPSHAIQRVEIIAP